MGVKRGGARVRGERRGGGMVAILQNSADAYSWGPGRGLGNEGCSLRLGSRRLRWDRRALGRPGRDWDPRSPVDTVLLTGPQLASTFPRPSALISVSATQTRKYKSPHPLPSTGKHAEVTLTVVQVVGLNDRSIPHIFPEHLLCAATDEQSSDRE